MCVDDNIIISWRSCGLLEVPSTISILWLRFVLINILSEIEHNMIVLCISIYLSNYSIKQANLCILAESIINHLDMVENADVQIIWQTGKYYNKAIMDTLAQHKPIKNLKVMDFISDMGAAYKAADLVISRAGASSISEFCLIGKPVILVPSPNVAEDHQTKNALALVNKDAALYVKDIEAPDTLLNTALKTVNDEAKLASLSENIKKLGLKNSADVIADEVLKLATGK